MTQLSPKNIENSNNNEDLTAKAFKLRGIREKVTSTGLTLARNTLFAGLLVIAIHWADSQYKIFNRFSKVGREFWLTTGIGIITTIVETYGQKEKEKIEIAQNNSIANAELITKLTTRLENQISSLMIQITQVNANINDLYGGIELVKRDERLLDQKIDENHYDVQLERFKLLRLFYEEIMKIQTDLAYLRGLNDADKNVMNRLNQYMSEYEPEQLDKPIDDTNINT